MDMQALARAEGSLGIALSGGGAKGAFQVGAIHELVTVRGVDFGIIGGTSTGALQSIGLAQDMVPELLDTWLSLKSEKDVYRKRLFGLAGAIFGANAMHNTKPLRALIEGFVDEAKVREVGKVLRLGVVNLQQGTFVGVDETSRNLADWIYASCAMPVYFDPLQTRTGAGGSLEQWVDGGVRDVTPLGAVLEAKPRAVLAVRASPTVKKPKLEEFSDLFEVAKRCVAIQTAETEANDTERARWVNDLLAARKEQMEVLRAEGLDEAQIRRICAPLEAELGGYVQAPVVVIEPEEEVSDTLQFDPVVIRRAIDLGRRAVDERWDELERLFA